ncbi:hypothetical protein ACGF0J_07255 [Nonomuraea sp. NPDC047897]|uniref:hypothetical protein n=1 Tax=Nonomuraea sp. NPDC047897 TaxID=3364346 RepID=UPI003717C7A4
MKRIVTGLALATAATLVTAGPAQAAAPKNPVVAVKKQMVAGKGVTFAERVTVFEGRERAVFLRRTGTYQFKSSGIAASDITAKFNIKASDLGEDADSEVGKMLTTPERSITVGRTSYLSGGIWDSIMTEGETWYKVDGPVHGGFTAVYGQPLNVVGEPATLKTLLKGAKPAAGGYTGRITLGELRKVSPWFKASMLGQRAKAKTAKSVLSWKLTVDAKGLPTRLVTTLPAAALGMSGAKDEGFSIDTRYSGWGAKVSIKAPSADEVATDLKKGAELPTDLQEIPLGSIVQ